MKFKFWKIIEKYFFHKIKIYPLHFFKNKNLKMESAISARINRFRYGDPMPKY